MKDERTMSEDSDELAWAEEGEELPAAVTGAAWKVLVIDDDPAVHSVSRLALQHLRVDGAPLVFFGAHSAREGRALLLAHPDAALVLLDVVMETDDAGLRLVEWLRREQGNTMLRILLRTGQPGQAPEMEVMTGYDINDYLAKVDVTTQRLITSVIAGVRAYRDLRTITIQRSGLHKVIQATSTLFETDSLERLLAGILEQVAGLLLPRESTIFFVARRPLFAPTDLTPVIIAASGKYGEARGRPVREVLAPAVLRDVERSLAGDPVESRDYSIYTFNLGGDACPVLYLDGGGVLEVWEHQMVALFCANAVMALRNHRMYEDQRQWLRAFERFVPTAMGRLVDRADLRKVEVGDHVARDMTILFMDLVAFTARSERMAPPAVFELLNQLYAVIGPCLEGHGGVIDKYLGDGVMVIFPDGAQGACEAALAVLAALDRFNAEHPLADGPLAMGIGVHHGPVILGMVGHARRIAPTVIADAVNTAARIQEWTRLLGTRLLLSRAVVEEISPGGMDASRSLGRLPMRGRTQPVEVIEVYAAENAASRGRRVATAESFAAAVEKLASGARGAAAAHLADVLAVDPGDSVAQYLFGLCADAW